MNKNLFQHCIKTGRLLLCLVCLSAFFIISNTVGASADTAEIQVNGNLDNLIPPGQQYHFTDINNQADDDNFVSYKSTGCPVLALHWYVNGVPNDGYDQFADVTIYSDGTSGTTNCFDTSIGITPGTEYSIDIQFDEGFQLDHTIGDPLSGIVPDDGVEIRLYVTRKANFNRLFIFYEYSNHEFYDSPNFYLDNLTVLIDGVERALPKDGKIPWLTEGSKYEIQVTPSTEKCPTSAGKDYDYYMYGYNGVTLGSLTGTIGKGTNMVKLSFSHVKYKNNPDTAKPEDDDDDERDDDAEDEGDDYYEDDEIIAPIDISTVDVSLSGKKFSYKGRAIKPDVVIADKYRRGSDYTVEYSDNKNVGTAKVTVTGCGQLKGSRTLTFKIVPATPKISSITAKASSLQINLKKQSNQVSGYEIMISKSKSFKKSSTKTINIASGKTVKLTVSQLTRGKNYYLKIRSYRKVNTVKYYSGYTSVYSVKTKR